MKKSIAIVLIVAVLAAIAVSAVGCNLFKDISIDEVKSNLEAADYQVEVLTGAQYIEQSGNPYLLNDFDLDAYLCGVKGEEKIELFVFSSTDTASNNYDFMHSDLPASGQSNKVVYFATKQAQKDAQL